MGLRGSLEIATSAWYVVVRGAANHILLFGLPSARHVGTAYVSNLLGAGFSMS